MSIDRPLVVLACSLVVASASGCVFKSSTSQASSESSSDSSSSSSKSSSGEESKSDGVAYERDVRDATARNAAAAADTRTYEKSISQLAGSHRISDWESDPHTYIGIGRGLAQAGIGEAEFGRLADDLSHGNSRYRDLIRSGYDAAKP